MHRRQPLRPVVHESAQPRSRSSPGSIETYRGVRPECQDARRSGVPAWTCRPRLAQGRECASARAFAPPARGAGHKWAVNLVQLSALALATDPRRFASVALTYILVGFGLLPFHERLVCDSFGLR